MMSLKEVTQSAAVISGSGVTLSPTQLSNIEPDIHSAISQAAEVGNGKQTANLTIEDNFGMNQEECIDNSDDQAKQNVKTLEVRPHSINFRHNTFAVQANPSINNIMSYR